MYINIIIKTFILYFFIVICYRIMGKKEVGQLSIIDLIVSILIAELAAMSIEETNRSILISVIPIALLVIIQVSLSLLTLKSNAFRKFIDGNPQVLINKGKVNFKQMQKTRYSLDDLITQEGMVAPSQTPAAGVSGGVNSQQPRLRKIKRPKKSDTNFLGRFVYVGTLIPVLSLSVI